MYVAEVTFFRLLFSTHLASGINSTSRSDGGIDIYIVYAVPVATDAHAELERCGLQLGRKLNWGADCSPDGIMVGVRGGDNAVLALELEKSGCHLVVGGS